MAASKARAPVRARSVGLKKPPPKRASGKKKEANKVRGETRGRDRGARAPMGVFFLFPETQ